MTTETKALYCAKDRTKAEVYGTAAGPERVECPTCGQKDTVEDATGEAVKAEVAAMFGSLGGSKNLKVSAPGPSPRWVFGAG